MMNEPSSWRRLLISAQPEYGRPAARLNCYFSRLMRGSDLDGLRVLEVGAGNGLLSFLMAELGASVVALEPLGAGANPEMERNRERYADASTAPDNVKFVNARFQEYDGEGKFDILVLHNSINHLAEDECRDLQRNARSRSVYERLFGRMAALSTAKGRLWVSDCGRRNLLGDLRLPNPLAPSIDWTLHQEPAVWVSLARTAGFVHSEVTWNVPTALRNVPNYAPIQRLVSYSTTSHFTLRLVKSGGST